MFTREQRQTQKKRSSLFWLSYKRGDSLLDSEKVEPIVRAELAFSPSLEIVRIDSVAASLFEKEFVSAFGFTFF